MPRSSVLKGKRFETELRHYISDRLGLTVHRTAATQQIADRSRGHADLIGTPHLAIEAKRTERFDLEGSLNQAIRNATANEIPVVINRRNRLPTGESRVVLQLDDFLAMYEIYLRHHGELP
ncbi:hypothetical protein UFOVP706_58 [uncultured Caudovirales phage]|uniref:Uncharacterized protein n=1 Tax=uncultured Caudovirales phage TaxID=2100421 RepID=A0A6J5NJX1_9CAUD|nr:hypothetical protein UFOVP706_58 [uncultured Caudovirales phage]